MTNPKEEGREGGWVAGGGGPGKGAGAGED